MSKIPPIHEMMTRSLMTISAQEPVRKAKLMMSSHSIRHLPVVDKGRLIGILSDRDVKLAQAVSERKDFDESVSVQEICQTKPYVVDGETAADKVLEHMYKTRIGSALITDGRKLIGIFTVTDACKAFAAFLRDSNA